MTIFVMTPLAELVVAVVAVGLSLATYSTIDALSDLFGDMKKRKEKKK